MSIVRPVFLAMLCVAAGCTKSTDEYLDDLQSFRPSVSGPSRELDATVVFDEGQLAHEAFAGLARTDSMSRGQVIATLAYACDYLGLARDAALSNSDAAVLIGRLATRIPLPPIDIELEVPSSEQVPFEEFNKLLKAQVPLRWELLIEQLDAGDRIAAADVQSQLESETSVSFGDDVDAWRAWYAAKKPEFELQFTSESREPLRRLGTFRYRNASEARSVLGVVGTWLRTYPDSSVADIAFEAAQRIGRQAAVHSLNEAMIVNRSSQVHADLAEAMVALADPSFESSLLFRLERERDPTTVARIMRALRIYPGRKTIQGLLYSMGLMEHPQVDLAARETLVSITGETDANTVADWIAWWDAKGQTTWP